MRRPGLLLAAFAACVIFPRLGGRGLWASHEARAAQHAQVILDDGDVGLPRLFDGSADMQKPPGYYWLAAACSWPAGGVSPLTVRLPAALAAWGCVLAVFAFLRGQGRPAAGLVAALVLLTAVRFTGSARVARIDMPLALAVSGALMLAASGRGGAWACLAAGVLLKGPVAVVLPAAVWCADRFTTRRLPGVSASGVGLFFAAASPWFVWAHLHTGGEFTRTFFWYHNVDRAAGGAAALASHPWWYYGPRLAIDFLPWTVALPLLRRPDRDAEFGLVGAAAVLAALSCVSFKRADYLLPLYPGLAIAVGCALERRSRVVITAAAVTAVGWHAHNAVRGDAEHDARPFAAEVRRLADGPVLFFRAEDHQIAYLLGRRVHTLVEWADLLGLLVRAGRHDLLIPEAHWSQCRRVVGPAHLKVLARDARPRRRLLLVRFSPWIDRPRCTADGRRPEPDPVRPRPGGPAPRRPR